MQAATSPGSRRRLALADMVLQPDARHAGLLLSAIREAGIAN
jgi:hypothetical protein